MLCIKRTEAFIVIEAYCFYEFTVLLVCKLTLKTRTLSLYLKNGMDRHYIYYIKIVNLDTLYKNAFSAHLLCTHCKSIANECK